MARKSVSGSLKEEINNARSNLDNLLHKINHTKDHGLENSDEEDDELRLDGSPARDGALGDSSRRKTQSSKRRKKGADRPQSASGNTYVVKLFDRSVDLSPYNDSTPLYPIARSWMRNTANDSYIEQAPQPEQVRGGEEQFPAPYMTSDDEDLYKLRIPEPIKRNDKPLDIYAEPENAQELLLNHIAHWKEVRSSWRTAGKAYDARFATSHSLIKQMYESASK